jgi:hypothetical protein
MKQYRIVSYERMPNSRNGNPRFQLALWDGETEEGLIAYTKADADFAYGLDLRKGYIRAEIVMRGLRATITAASTN